MLGSKVETPLLKTERWTSSESPWRRWLTQHNPFFRPRHTSLFRNLLIMGLNTAAWEQAVFILWQESNQYDQSRQRQQRASAYFCSITMQQWGEVVYSRKAWHRFFFFYSFKACPFELQSWHFMPVDEHKQCIPLFTTHGQMRETLDLIPFAFRLQACCWAPCGAHKACVPTLSPGFWGCNNSRPASAYYRLVVADGSTAW